MQSEPRCELHRRRRDTPNGSEVERKEHVCHLSELEERTLETSKILKDIRSRAKLTSSQV